MSEPSAISARSFRKVTYPHKFFDYSSLYMPRTIKGMFKYCRAFFYRSGFINSVITKMTEYPITDIKYDKKTDEQKKELYDEFFRHQLKLKSMLIEIGLDYFTYGNSFISASLDFKRYLKCSKCGATHPIDDIKYKYENHKFKGRCPKCSSAGVSGSEFTIEDVYLTDKTALNFVRWSPEHIDIEYDHITGKSTYFYNIPSEIKKKVRVGNKTQLRTIPKLFLRALEKNRKVKFDNNNLYHFKRNTLAEEDMGFGKPILLSVMSDIWYMNTLRRGNEAIAAEHIVPFRVLYPSSAGNLDPYTQMNLGNWKSNLQYNIDLWRDDPNHIAIFPIPIGAQNIGGDARVLNVTPELKFTEESIINALGVPIEFIKGGASWTGSTISLRIVENHFLHYRSLMEDFINYFIVKKSSDLVKMPKIKVTFTRLRMADDSETKRIVMELAATGKISTPTLLDEFGVDYAAEQQNIKDSREFETELATNSAKNQAEAAGTGMEIQARAQVRAQTAMLDEQAKERERHFKEELASEVASQAKNISTSEFLEKFTEEIMMMDPEAQLKTLEGLSKKFPYMTGMIQKRIEEKMVAGMQGMQEEEGAAEAEEPSAAKEKAKPKKKDESSKKNPGAPKDGSV